MVCSNCGEVNEDGADICKRCEKVLVKKTGTDNNYEQKYNIYGNYGKPRHEHQFSDDANFRRPNFEEQYRKKPVVDTIIPTPPMKWYNFEVCLGLFVSAIFDLLAGFACVTGLIYNHATEEYFDIFPDPILLLRIGGLFSIFYGIYSFILRQQLANFKSSAVLSFKLYFIIDLAMSMLGIVFLRMKYGIITDTTQTLIKFIIGILTIFT